MFGLQHSDLNLGSTSSLAPVLYIYFTLDHVGNVNSGSGSSSRSTFEFQIVYLNLGSTPSLAPSHLCLTFEHVGRSTLELDPAPDLYFSYTFWPEILLYSYYGNPMLSSKFNILSYNSVPSGQISIILLQAGVIFFADNQFESICAIKHMLSSKLNVLFDYSIPSVQNWKKSFTSRGCVFQTIFWVQQPYVIFKIECFVP